MNEIVELKGDWIGFYTFDKGYTEVDKLSKVPFRLTIERAINEFVGRIVEDPNYGGIDDDIIIKGRQNGNDIEFTKHYAREHFSGQDGSIDSVDSENPTIVYYSGSFDGVTGKFKGEWQIPALREDDEGIFHEDNATGFWEIWREG
jgi:hypothetical protein